MASTGAQSGGSKEQEAAALFKIRKTDRFGFFIDTPATTDDASSVKPPSTPTAHVVTERKLEDPTPSTPAKVRKRIRLENQRTEKWRDMLSHWSLYRGKKSNVLKRRLRKGCSEALRGVVWTRLVGADERRAAHPELYGTLLRKSYASTAEIIDVIERDISRTLPRHVMFSEAGGLGQQALFRVLRAYAMHDETVGYCQGMGFFTALFLIYMPEEDAFFMLLSLMQFDPFKLRRMYEPGMPMVGLVQYQFDGLMQKKLPTLSKHLAKQGLHPTIYSAQWFISLFTYNFSCDLSTRVWDSFLVEGWKIIFRVALAIMKINKDRLLKMKFEGIMMFLAKMPSLTETEQVIKVAFALSLKRSELDALENAYIATQMSTTDLAHSVARG